MTWLELKTLPPIPPSGHGLVVIPVAVGGDGFKNVRCLIKTTKLPQDLNGESVLCRITQLTDADSQAFASLQIKPDSLDSIFL